MATPDRRVSMASTIPSTSYNVDANLARCNSAAVAATGVNILDTASPCACSRPCRASLFGYNVAVVAGALGFLAASFRLCTVRPGALVTSILVGALPAPWRSGEAAARWGARRVPLPRRRFSSSCRRCSPSPGAPGRSTAARPARAGGRHGLDGGAALCCRMRCGGGAAPWSPCFQLGVTAGSSRLSRRLCLHRSGATGVPCLPWRRTGPRALAGLLALPESPRWLALRGRPGSGPRRSRAPAGRRADVGELQDPGDVSAPLDRAFQPTRARRSGHGGRPLPVPEPRRDRRHPLLRPRNLPFGRLQGGDRRHPGDRGLGTINLARHRGRACSWSTARAPAAADRRLPGDDGEPAPVGLTLGGSNDDAAITLVGLTAYILAFAVSLGPLALCPDVGGLSACRCARGA